ncbi:MAG: hypothetical protein P0Y60_05095 [Candidatus Microbacterium colombiense]|nr:MAG: hypothetical protein P0Y60_05095 [Microbacterium sp.]
MNDHELDERLRRADPAGPVPEALDATMDRLVAQPLAGRPRRRWRPIVAVGGTLVLVGALAAATDIDSFLLSVPPFAGLEYGADFRPASGLPFVPTEGQDRGEQCRLYVDLGGLTDEQRTAVGDYWASADPAVFAAAVQERKQNPREEDIGYPESIESWAVVEQSLVVLDQVVPGIAWGAATPGESFEPGDPHLASVTQLCRDDLDGIEPTE